MLDMQVRSAKCPIFRSGHTISEPSATYAHLQKTEPVNWSGFTVQPRFPRRITANIWFLNTVVGRVYTAHCVSGRLRTLRSEVLPDIRLDRMRNRRPFAKILAIAFGWPSRSMFGSGRAARSWQSLGKHWSYCSVPRAAVSLDRLPSSFHPVSSSSALSTYCLRVSRMWGVYRRSVGRDRSLPLPHFCHLGWFPANPLSYTFPHVH